MSDSTWCGEIPCFRLTGGSREPDKCPQRDVLRFCRSVRGFLAVSVADEFQPEVAEPVGLLLPTGAHQVFEAHAAGSGRVHPAAVTVEEEGQEHFQGPGLPGTVRASQHQASAGEGEFGLVVVPDIDHACPMQAPPMRMVLWRGLLDAGGPADHGDRTRAIHGGHVISPVSSVNNGSCVSCGSAPSRRLARVVADTSRTLGR